MYHESISVNFFKSDNDTIISVNRMDLILEDMWSNIQVLSILMSAVYFQKIASQT